MKLFIKIVILIVAVSGVFLFFQKNNLVEIDIKKELASLIVPEAEPTEKIDPIPINADIEPQKPLENPPKEIKAIYSTGWSAGSQSKVDYFINLIKTTGLNAIIIDIKDYSGNVAYKIENADVEKYGAKEIRIPQINKLIKRFHDEGIYVIARITIFQDPILAKARPDLAIHSRSKLTPNTQNLTPETLWLDHKKLAWMDPASKDVWDYNIAIAKDAANRGFDELNFDYIRFASDGNLDDMVFPFWDEKTLKSRTIKIFFKYLREQLVGIKISADLFGLTTVQKDDLGIGQIIEDAYQYFDFVAPMVYPSHYATGFNGYKNPAEHPYEVVKYSIESALKRIATSTITEAKLRPWLQDFDLGADYDAEKVKAQIKAVYDAASSTPEFINGYMLWDPRNVYTKEALTQ